MAISIEMFISICADWIDNLRQHWFSVKRRHQVDRSTGCSDRGRNIPTVYSDVPRLLVPHVHAITEHSHSVGTCHRGTSGHASVFHTPAGSMHRSAQGLCGFTKIRCHWLTCARLWRAIPIAKYPNKHGKYLAVAKVTCMASQEVQNVKFFMHNYSLVTLN